MRAADTSRATRTMALFAAGDFHDRSRTVLRVSIVFLVLTTIFVAIEPRINGHAVAPALDLVIDTVAAVVCLWVATLSWVRFRERRERVALYEAAAFLALALAYSAAVTVTLGRDADAAERAMTSEGQAWLFAVARVTAAVLLVIGATRYIGGAEPRRPLAVLLVPTMLVGATAIVSHATDLRIDALSLLAPGAIDRLPEITPLGVMVEVVAASLFFVAAVALRATWRREHAALDAWLAVGLVFAGFAEIHWIINPSGHPGQVSTADVLRLAFFVALLVGIEAEARMTLGRLRSANHELSTLREHEVDRAALEERARLARELHDGLAQDLWLAKLRAAEAASVPGLPAASVLLLQQTEAAIDSGLAEARQAVLALRLSVGGEEGFCDLIQRFVDDFEDRFGLRVEFKCADDVANVPPRTQAEVLRIAQEALTNVRQHASATVVGMRLTVRRGRLSLHVSDNGCGFEARRVGRRSFGLQSMRERAGLIGGRLRIHSAPGDGTHVVLTAPAHGLQPALVPSGVGE